ncbi:MAG TPA: condensation domain-containing protein, partial [Umezawaea sp.]|nr:condensation domain-containing protein [Umezawaea sp.]
MRDHPDCATRYDLVYLCSLSGDVDLDGLRAAVGDLVRRHAALRTTVTPTTQRVHPAEAFAELSRPGPEESVASVVRDLARGRHGLSDVVSGRPLFRAGEHRVVGDRGEVTLMSLKIHHLVYDGWSLSVIWRDLAELYRARVFGGQARLPVPRTTYADFTEACLRERRGVAAVAVDHWRAATADCPERIPWRAPAGT